MAYGKRFWVYPAAAVLLAVVIIAATAIYMGVQTKTAPSSYSVLAIKLTDPPQVPDGTQWLNMTFTQVALLVAEPTGSSGQVNMETVTITPQGGSATIDLLALQNYTYTLAQANLPQGSVVYSVTFTVSKIVINVNGTQSPVTITGGATTLQAVIANPKSLTGDNEALIQLNPVVVNTPSGYELIPSTVAVITPSHGQEHEGGVSTLSQQEAQELEEATGNISVKILSLSVSGKNTTFMLLVNNTGSIPVQLVAVGLHGEFNVTGSACRAGQEGENNQSQGDNNQSSNGMGDHQGGQDNSGDSASVVPLNPADYVECEHPDQVAFVPLNTSSTQATSTTTSTTTTSTTSASSAKCQVFNMTVVNGEDGNDNSQGDENQQSAGIVIQPHECVELVFKGAIGLGSSNLTLVPSLTTGSTYTIHIIASNSAEQKLECTVPVSPASCKPVTSDNNGS
jgi:hypothetical protein